MKCNSVGRSVSAVKLLQRKCDFSQICEERVLITSAFDHQITVKRFEVELAALAYPPVSLDGNQARAVGEGFAKFSASSKLGIWACSILPEHIHLVIGRHRYKIEIAANLLKGAATKRLKEIGLHPMAIHKQEDGRIPRMWARDQWIVYLDSEQSIENAIDYAGANPAREGKRQQKWNCVIPFTGISTGGWVTYH